MKFIVSAWVSEEVLKDLNRIHNLFEEEIQMRIADIVLKGPATGVLWIPCLTRPEFPELPPKSIYRRGEVRLKRHINYAGWVAGDDRVKTELYVAAFIEALEAMSARSLPESDKDQLRAVIRESAPAVLSRISGSPAFF